MADKKKKDIVSSLIDKAVKASGTNAGKKSNSPQTAAKKTASSKSTDAKKGETVKNPSKKGHSSVAAPKQVKSKEQQGKDIVSLGATVVAAGVAASKAAAAKNKGKSNKAINALIVVLCLILFATGVMYYFDITPLDFALDGFEFKYYTYEVGNFAEDDIPAHLEGELKIHFIDVGQGDCIFIQFPDGKTMLIDGGENRTAVAQGIINYLLALYEQEEVTVDYLMLTHCDSDHCGSLDEVIKSDKIDVFNVYQPRVYSKYENDLLKKYVEDNTMNNPQGNWKYVPTITTGVYASFAEAVYMEKDKLEDFGEIIYNFEGLEIHGDGWSIYMYNPCEDMYKNLSTAKAKNNISPIMVLCFGEYRILLTGDADEKAEENFVTNINMFSDSFEWNGCDVLKVAHHGGAESTGELFLDNTRPKYAVISAGENNKYDHPRKSTLNNLAEFVGQNIFITYEYGSIVLTIDSSGLSWEGSKKEIPVFASLFTAGVELMCYNLLYGNIINPLRTK